MGWLLILALGAAFLASSVVSYLRYVPHPAKPAAGKLHIACIGDSITFGSGVIKTRARDAWASVLEKSLGDGFQVLNYGVSGATLQNEGG